MEIASELSSIFEKDKNVGPKQKFKNGHSDEDSVCADIDRWGGSSVGDSSSITESRIKELEEEQQRLSDSLVTLSTQFARVQFRIQQINQAPVEKRDELLRELNELASSSCMDLNGLKREALSTSGVNDEEDRQQKQGPIQELIGSLRQHLEEVEQFAYKSGQLPEGEIPLTELRQRQKLLLEKLREKLRLQIELERPTTSPDQFLEFVDQNIDQALEPMREKEKLVGQLRTQITDLERFVKLLQSEIGSPPQSPVKKYSAQHPQSSVEQAEQEDINLSLSENADRPLELRKPFSDKKQHNSTFHGGSKSFLGNLFGFQKRHFERNELKHTSLGNHYGDQRAELELVLHDVVETLKKNQILSIDRPDRGDLPVEQLNEAVSKCSHPESVVTIIRKRFCPSLRVLLEHGLRAIVAPSAQRGGRLSSVVGLARFSSHGQVNSKYLRPELCKFDGFKIVHIWDVLQLFFELSRALEMRDAVIGSLSEAYKLDSIDGKIATSKQILLCTIENIINSHQRFGNSHQRLKRSPDSMWKAFVSAALNRNRLPAWIRIIFRSEMVLKKCYHDWSYVARTGCEDIRPLLEGLHEFNFDLPVDLAVRPFEHIREAF